MVNVDSCEQEIKQANNAHNNNVLKESSNVGDLMQAMRSSQCMEYET